MHADGLSATAVTIHHMKAPPRLQSLIEEGLIDTVVRQLMSGKEAMVFVVRCGDETRCAKIYKEANNRSFRQAVDYTENRKVKNSRSARAMAKGSKFGRQEQEAAWQSAEVDALYRLAAAGVRVPQPYNFHDGVLLMELVTDAHGDAAPRLNDVAFTPAQALAHHATLIAEVVRMLCAGVVHGDLSEFNILLAHMPRRSRRRRWRGRARHHRPAAGGRRCGQQPRPAHAAARRGQPARFLWPVCARASEAPTLAPRSGACTRPGC